MGYASYNNFAHVIENGQFFLIRCNDKRLGGIFGRRAVGLKEMDCRVERILTETSPERNAHARCCLNATGTARLSLLITWMKATANTKSPCVLSGSKSYPDVLRTS